MARCTEASVYREAALLVEKHDMPAPMAIKRAAGQALMTASPQVDALRNVFAEDPDGLFWPWTIEPNRKDLRVLALGFMAAMVEAGDA